MIERTSLFHRLRKLQVNFQQILWQSILRRIDLNQFWRSRVTLGNVYRAQQGPIEKYIVLKASCQWNNRLKDYSVIITFVSSKYLSFPSFHLNF